jgi:gamma-glutamylcyclotransferase (GGCT)/AIG2-like uncharacterized protein YtfP
MPLLFSYGTLQQANVQQATFGRLLAGRADELLMYSRSLIEITDAAVLATSGTAQHPIVRFTGRPADRVAGTVFEVTELELAHADDYEVDDYVRVRAALASGHEAWVYVDAGGAPPGEA